MARTHEEIKKAILDWLNDNTDAFVEIIEDLDGWNGYLGDDRYYCMEDLDEIYHGTEATEILFRAFYGYDEDEYTVDQYGRKEHAAFNPNREYFRYNGYGNRNSIQLQY